MKYQRGTQLIAKYVEFPNKKQTFKKKGEFVYRQNSSDTSVRNTYHTAIINWMLIAFYNAYGAFI